MGWLKGILAAIPAIHGILSIFQKWFPAKTERELGEDRLKDRSKDRKKTAHKINTAIKDARKGDTKSVEDIINRSK